MKRVVLIRSNPVMPDPPVEKVADTLLEAGYAVTIVAWDRFAAEDKEVQQQFAHGSAQVVRFGIPSAFGGGLRTLGAMLRFQWKLLVWLRRNRNCFDIIHAFDLDTGLAACTALRGKRLVYHILDFYADVRFDGGLTHRMVSWLERKVLERADAVMICTEQRRGQLGSSRPKHLEVIHNAPPEVVPEQPDQLLRLQTGAGSVKLAYVGTLTDGRGILQMLDVVKKDPRYELHIGGYGPLEGAVQNAAAEGTGVFWYGRLPYEQTLALECQCDIMLALYDPTIPNHRYAAPNKLYEAMMLGKPVLTCSGIGWDKEIERHKTGVLIHFGADGIKDGLDELYRRRDQWRAMGENGRARYTEQYSWQTMKQRIRGIYSLLG